MDFPFRTFTKLGTQAVILAELQPSPKPLIGAYFSEEGMRWYPCAWTKEGSYMDDPSEECSLDINISG